MLCCYYCITFLLFHGNLLAKLPSGGIQGIIKVRPEGSDYRFAQKLIHPYSFAAAAFECASAYVPPMKVKGNHTAAQTPQPYGIKTA